MICNPLEDPTRQGSEQNPPPKKQNLSRLHARLHPLNNHPRGCTHDSRPTDDGIVRGAWYSGDSNSVVRPTRIPVPPVLIADKHCRDRRYQKWLWTMGRLQATVSFSATTPLKLPSHSSPPACSLDRSFAMLPVPIIIVRFVMIS